MGDPLEVTPERSARYARIAYACAVALAALVGYLAKTLTFLTDVETFTNGSPPITREYPWIDGNSLGDWLLVLSPLAISVAFAIASELALRRRSNTWAMVALGLAAVAVLGALAVMFGRGVVYVAPWAAAIAGSIVLTLQAIEADD